MTTTYYYYLPGAETSNEAPAVEYEAWRPNLPTAPTAMVYLGGVRVRARIGVVVGASVRVRVTSTKAMVYRLKSQLS